MVDHPAVLAYCWWTFKALLFRGLWAYFVVIAMDVQKDVVGWKSLLLDYVSHAGICCHWFVTCRRWNIKEIKSPFQNFCISHLLDSWIYGC